MSLRVSKISKRNGDKWILRDVEFHVEKGEIVGLLGGLGAGKTTLLRIIAGLERPNGGSLLYDSDIVTNLSPAARGFELPGVEKRSLFSSLFNSKNKAPFAAFENVLRTSARVLLLDDIFAGLDSSLREACIDKLSSTAKEKNIAVIYASNDPETIFSLADRAAVLDGGEIRQTGTPHELYEAPNSVAVATATGRNNIFDARRLTSSKADLPEFITLDGEHRLFAEKTDVGRLGAINQNVALAIRPEQIVISFGASFPEDNLIKAIVTGIRYFGATTIIELDSNGLKLEALVLRLVGLNIGDECMLGLPPDRIRILRN